MKQIAWLSLTALVLGCAADEAPRGAVDVTVQLPDSADPAPGVTVVFHDEGGAVLSTAVTGSDGKATGEIPEGGQITIARTDDLVTIAGASPGDSYTIAGSPTPGRIPLGTAQITTPGALGGAPAGATYSLSVGCNAQSYTTATPTLSVPVFPPCPASDGSVHVLARVLTSTGALAGFSAVTGTAGGGGWTATLPAWTTASALTLTLDGAPAGTVAVRAELDFVFGDRSFQGSRVFADGQSATFSFPFDGAVVDALALTSVASFGEGGYASLATIGPPGATTQRVTLSSALLPRVVSADVTGGARAEMAWSVAGDLDGIDGGVATFTWDESSAKWRVVVGPGTASPIKLPALPEELATLRPTSAQGAPTLSFWDSSGVSTYEAFVTAVLARDLTRPPTSGTLTVRETHFGE